MQTAVTVHKQYTHRHTEAVIKQKYKTSEMTSSALRNNNRAKDESICQTETRLHSLLVNVEDKRQTQQYA